MCILKIYSDSMSFERFSERTSLPIFGFQVKGRPVRARSDRTYESHRLSIDVSDKDWSDFDGQVADAISFLTNHEQELLELLHSHAVTNAYLDFPLYSRLSSEMFEQSERFPHELIVLAGRIGLGIRMAIYEKNVIDELFGDLDR